MESEGITKVHHSLTRGDVNVWDMVHGLTSWSRRAPRTINLQSHAVTTQREFVLFEYYNPVSNKKPKDTEIISVLRRRVLRIFWHIGSNSLRSEWGSLNWIYALFSALSLSSGGNLTDQQSISPDRAKLSLIRICSRFFFFQLGSSLTRFQSKHVFQQMCHFSRVWSIIQSVVQKWCKQQDAARPSTVFVSPFLSLVRLCGRLQRWKKTEKETVAHDCIRIKYRCLMPWS